MALELYQYPDGSEAMGLPQAVRIGDVNCYTCRMSATDLAEHGYKRIIDVTDIPPGHWRRNSYTDVDTGAVIERTYDTEAIPPPTTVELAQAVRAERDRRIEAVTWRIERYESETRQGVTSTTDGIAALDSYAQALRDLPGQPGFPWQGPEDEAVPWPEEP